MRPGAHQDVPTVSEIVHRAIAACDFDDGDPLLADLLVRFEDRDEPVTAVPDIEQEVAEATGALDPDRVSPALTMAGAVVVYLAHRRDHVDHDPDELLRLAARAELSGDGNSAVEEWLAVHGVEL